MANMKKSIKLEIERRRFPRVTVQVTCTIKGSTKKQSVLNMSLGGVRIYCDERVDIGQELDLQFFIPNGAVIEARGRVVWLEELPRGSKGIFDVGMELTKVSKEKRKILSAFLREK